MRCDNFTKGWETVTQDVSSPRGKGSKPRVSFIALTAFRELNTPTLGTLSNSFNVRWCSCTIEINATNSVFFNILFSYIEVDLDPMFRN